MKVVEVRKLRIGEGIPKICIPIVEHTKEAIVKEAMQLRTSPADIVEWRVDWYEGAEEIEKVLDVAACLRKELEELPLLCTFRTAKEGGEREISDKAYEQLNTALITSGAVDVIDVEAFQEVSVVKRLIEIARKAGIKVIASNHDFQKTPPKEEVVRRLKFMQELGADIPKIAVMPQNRQDVLELLSATLEMTEQYAKQPIITMAMAKEGVISRIAGEMFGSALTFATAGKASAPGQINAHDMKHILEILHTN